MNECENSRKRSVMSYTEGDMEFLNNRYVQLALLTLGLGLLFWALFWVVLLALGIREFPVFLQVMAAFLGAGVLVAKFFAGRIF